MSRNRRRRGGSRALVPVKPGGQLPAELNRVIASTGDGRDITRPFIGFELEEFRDRRLLGAVDWGVYDVILLDDQVKSCLEQRRSAVVSREWSVASGDEKDPRANAAAAALEANILQVGWDRVTDKMLYAPFYGVAIAELGWGPWQYEGRTLYGWVRNGETRPIHVRHARRFRYDRERRLRHITPQNVRGEIVPDRKFWVVTAGGSDDDHLYGRGLAEWLYWPTLFKRNGIRFWNMFLDKFSVPTAKGTYPRGATEAEIAKLLEALQSMANDSGFVVPEGMAVELLKGAQQGVPYEKMPEYMDGAIAKVILSQTMTTDAQATGIGSGLGNVHGGVKQELITADADLLTDSFTEGPARWFTDFNFGTDVAAPIVTRQVEEEEDLKATAETDEALGRMGYERTEESFTSIYGDGFRRKPSPPPPPPAPALTGRRGGPSPRPANDGARPEQDEGGERAATFAAFEPRPLYVHRRLRNAKDLIAWAKKQGFRSTLPAGDMHVTVAYSRRPVDWFAMGQAWSGSDGRMTVPPGGPRQVKRFDGGAIVLLFSSDDLEWRHKHMIEAGATWDHPEYRRHVTITYDGEGLDLEQVEPYQGELVFGPEIFEQLDGGWQDDLREVAFAEALPAGDIVDQAVAAIMEDEGWRTAMAPIVEPLFRELAEAKSPEDVTAILARAAELDDETTLTEQLARAGFAVRMAAATGQEGAAPAPMLTHG